MRMHSATFVFVIPEGLEKSAVRRRLWSAAEEAKARRGRDDEMRIEPIGEERIHRGDRALLGDLQLLKKLQINPHKLADLIRVAAVR